MLTLTEVQALAQLLSLGSGRFTIAEREYANQLLARLEAEAKKRDEITRPGREEIAR